MRDSSRDEGLQVCVSYTDRKGTKRTSGGRDLKGTEAYPFGFGAVIGKLHRAHVDKVAGDKVCAASDDWELPEDEGSEPDVEEGDACLDDLLSRSACST